MNSLAKKVILTVASALTAFAFAAGVMTTVGAGTLSPLSDGSLVLKGKLATATVVSGPTQSTPTKMIMTDQEYGFDPSNPEQLVENTNNVFVGTVIQQVGEKQIGVFSYPIFSVRVIKNVKGTAAEMIGVVQADVGYRNGYAYVSDGDIATPSNTNLDGILLKPGATYVFASLYVKSDGQYGISAAPFDRILVTSNSLSTSTLLEVASENQLARKLMDAAAPVVQ